MEAWALFIAVPNRDKGGVKKVITRICKVQSFYLSHCSQREGIIGKLEKNGYAYMQSALDHSLQSVLHDEITNFTNNTKKWKMLNHSESAEYLPLPMVHTHNLEHSFNLQVPIFGSILKSWIQDIFSYDEFSVPYIFRCKFLGIIQTGVSRITMMLNEHATYRCLEILIEGGKHKTFNFYP